MGVESGVPNPCPARLPKAQLRFVHTTQKRSLGILGFSPASPSQLPGEGERAGRLHGSGHLGGEVTMPVVSVTLPRSLPGSP